MGMKFLDWSDYNREARAYWWITLAAGGTAIGVAAVGLSTLNGVALAELLLLAGIVLFAGSYPTRLPGTQTCVTPGDVFVFLAALLWGAPAATLVAVIDAAAASVRSSRRWTSRLGSPAMMAIAILISTNVFESALKGLRSLQLYSTTTLLAALLLYAVLHFLLNSLMLAANYALKRRVRLLSVWWENYSWYGLTYTASASAAGLIYLAMMRYGLGFLLAAGPLVAIVFAACHFYFKQADEREKAIERVSRVHLATVEALATAIDAKDEITHDHVYRVQVYASGLGKHFGLSGPEIEALKAGALLHDVGKIAVPDYILNKPGKLTAAEFEKMKIHTVVGAQIMERVNFPYPVVPIVRHHHERWDGAGYPDGLRGQQIPMTARILTVADCFDAVREDRQYRKGMLREEACQFLRGGAGKQFDPNVVEAFLNNLPKYEDEIAAHKASLKPLLTPTTQAGISESARKATPAAGLATAAQEPPDYVKQIKSAHTEVAALYEMAQTLSGSIDVHDVVALAAKQLERTTPFTTCVFYMKQKNGDSVVAQYAFGENAEHIRGRALGMGQGIVGWVVVNGRPMSNTDPALDLDLLKVSGRSRYRTVAIYPLSGADGTIGALALYSADLGSYDAGQLHLIETVSRVASTALQHALLYEQTRATAQVDPLTGLPNPRALYTRFEELLSGSDQTSGPVSVLYLNVSRMRAVNQSHGYPAGDQLLAELGRLLRRQCNAGMLGRLASDEFVCLLADHSLAKAVQMGERLEAAVSQHRFDLGPERHVCVQITFGASEFPAEGGTLDALISSAAGAATRKKISPLPSVFEALESTSVQYSTLR
jgi:diguanylate cyclase (GGDEF)-like protein/putative nucleotidyltransferase with HDIG domain